MSPRFCWVTQVALPTREEKSNGMRNTVMIPFFCNQVFQGIGQLFFWPWYVSNSCIHILVLGQPVTISIAMGSSGKISLVSESRLIQEQARILPGYLPPHSVLLWRPVFLGRTGISQFSLTRITHAKVAILRS